MAKQRPTLLEDDKKGYIKSGGIRCPFCKSEQTEADALDADGPVATSNCRCVEQADDIVG